MTLTTEQITELAAALKRKGYDVRSYSGRCMFGSRCLGVNLDSAGQAIELGAAMKSEIGKVLKNTQTDSMGLGIIVYWPDIPYTESFPEDN